MDRTIAYVEGRETMNGGRGTGDMRWDCSEKGYVEEQIAHNADEDAGDLKEASWSNFVYVCVSV